VFSERRGPFRSRSCSCFCSDSSAFRSAPPYFYPSAQSPTFQSVTANPVTVPCAAQWLSTAVALQPFLSSYLRLPSISPSDRICRPFLAYIACPTRNLIPNLSASTSASGSSACHVIYLSQVIPRNLLSRSSHLPASVGSCVSVFPN